MLWNESTVDSWNKVSSNLQLNKVPPLKGKEEWDPLPVAVLSRRRLYYVVCM